MANDDIDLWAIAAQAIRERAGVHAIAYVRPGQRRLYGAVCSHLDFLYVRARDQRVSNRDGLQQTLRSGRDGEV